MLHLFTLFRLETLKVTHRKVFYIAYLALGFVSMMFVYSFSKFDFRWSKRAAKALDLNIDPLINGLFCTELAVF